ncbi:MAG: ABC transporter, partial [Dehalococcoidia bacterium]
RVAPVTDQTDTQQVLENREIRDNIMRISPTTLFEEATGTVLNPSTRTLRSLVTRDEVAGMVPGPLALGQSLKLVWPHLTALAALTVICFSISYLSFMRQEVRAG